MKKIISISIVILVLSLPVTFAASLTYDENGNLITGDGLYREYDSFNHLVRVRSGNTAASPLIVNYTWHPTEDRVLIKDVYFNGTINETVYYVSQSFVRVVNSSGTFDFTYVYQNEQLVGQINPDGSKLYMHDDHLGSTSLITNQSGATVEETFYDPFGGIVSGGATSRFNYEAKEYDPVTSDTDFHARKSKPQWAGMFTQPDSLISNVYDPQSLNHYMFERGNPYKYADSDGKNPYVVAALVGYTFGLNYYLWTHETPRYRGDAIEYIKEFSSYAGKGIASGVVAGVAAAAGVAVVTNGGRVVAQTSGVAAANFIIGFTEYYAEGAIAGDDLSLRDAAISGASSIPSVPGLPLRGGTFYSSTRITKNSVIIGLQYLGGVLYSSLISMVDNNAPTNTNGGTSSSDSCGTSGGGSMMQEDKRQSDKGICGVNMSCL